MLENLEGERQKTDETRTLWQQYNRTFDKGSLQLEHLRRQLSSFSLRQEPQVAVHSAEVSSRSSRSFVKLIGEPETSLLTCELDYFYGQTGGWSQSANRFYFE